MNPTIVTHQFCKNLCSLLPTVFFLSVAHYIHPFLYYTFPAMSFLTVTLLHCLLRGIYIFSNTFLSFKAFWVGRSPADIYKWNEWKPLVCDSFTGRRFIIPWFTQTEASFWLAISRDTRQRMFTLDSGGNASKWNNGRLREREPCPMFLSRLKIDLFLPIQQTPCILNQWMKDERYHLSETQWSTHGNRNCLWTRIEILYVHATVMCHPSWLFALQISSHYSEKWGKLLGARNKVFSSPSIFFKLDFRLSSG